MKVFSWKNKNFIVFLSQAGKNFLGAKNALSQQLSSSDSIVRFGGLFPYHGITNLKGGDTEKFTILIEKMRIAQCCISIIERGRNKDFSYTTLDWDLSSFLD